ncbi:MAG: hypothetical protein O6930_04770 [Gammaproteobacteria bacterium]|nr:hypothetical protein [Gammaproteobacteria bacterium]
MLQQRQILQDWTRVTDFDVGDAEVRTFEYHVVADVGMERVTLTIKCLDKGLKTVRLDPTDVSRENGQQGFADIAARRVRLLFVRGMI